MHVLGMAVKIVALVVAVAVVLIVALGIYLNSAVKNDPPVTDGDGNPVG